MTRATAAALITLALLTGLALRLARLDARPMHHDEANQAVKFGDLLERGAYRYDAQDHHGPTLYYLTLPAAWLAGQRTLATLDERTIRAVPAVFGAGTMLLLPWLVSGLGPRLGWTTATVSAWLLAVSPAMVYYSRTYIQESLFACFTLAFVLGLGRLATGGRRGWAVATGVAAGLAAATKETAIIVLPAAVLAAGVAGWTVATARRGAGAAGDEAAQVRATWPRGSGLARLAGIGLATAVVVAALFYSSFLTVPGGVLEPFRGAGTYLDRGLDPATHVHPWHYYVSMLAWSAAGGLRWTEGLILGLALVGVATAWRRPADADTARHGAFWARYLAIDALLVLFVFSALRYKTPWNVLPFLVIAILVAGLGAARLVHALPGRLAPAVIAAALAGGLWHLGDQAWRSAVTYGADPRNPYVYAHTVPDAVRMAGRIHEVTARGEGLVTPVSVIAPPHEQWPMPWYLRDMPNVGYWIAADDPTALSAPLIVASVDQTETLDAVLGDRYVSEYFGLRPEVLLTLYVERDLWERYLAAQTGDAGPES